MFYEKNFRENIINPFWTQLVNRAQACIREGFHPNYPDLNLRVIYFPSTWSTFHFPHSNHFAIQSVHGHKML